MASSPSRTPAPAPAPALTPSASPATVSPATRARKPAPASKTLSPAAESVMAKTASGLARKPGSTTVPAAKRAKPAKPAEPARKPTAVAPAAPAAPKALAAAAVAKLAKPAKHPKAKLVRDSFTMPQADFDLIAMLKQRALSFQRPAKKSELLRAGLYALQALDDAQLAAVLDALVTLKPGRPRAVG